MDFVNCVNFAAGGWITEFRDFVESETFKLDRLPRHKNHETLSLVLYGVSAQLYVDGHNLEALWWSHNQGATSISRHINFSIKINKYISFICRLIVFSVQIYTPVKKLTLPQIREYNLAKSRPIYFSIRL